MEISPPSIVPGFRSLWHDRGAPLGSCNQGGTMIVAVDTVQMTTALIEPEDCKRFHISAAGGDVDAVRRALGGCAYPDAHPDAAEGHALSILF